MRTVTQRVAATLSPVAIPMLLTVAVVALVSLGSESLQRDGVFMLVNMLAVVGLWVFVGNSGIISFGHASFLGIGAYASAVLTAEPQIKKLLIHGMPAFLANVHWSTTAALLMAAAVAAAFAAVIALPLMRLSGLSAGIATLAILIIVNVVLGQWRSVTNGLQTFSGIPADATLWSTLPYVLVGIGIAYAFRQSRLGLRLRASREDEIAAKSIGIGVLRERSVAFVVSAAIVGASGALYAHYLGAITPGLFYFQATFLMLAMLVAGGMKSLNGAVIGALTVSVLTHVLGEIEKGFSVASVRVPELQGLTDVALAALLIGILILQPRGLTRGRELRFPSRGRGHAADAAIGLDAPVAESRGVGG